MKHYLHPLNNIIFCLLALSCALSTGKKIINRTVVTVNGTIILESDITRFEKKIKSPSFSELFGGTNKKLLSNRKAILQLLIEEKIIDQQVEKLQLTATEQEIDGQINAIVTRNGITKAQLSLRLKELGTSMADYRKAIKRQIERKNLVDREIRPSLVVTEDQLRRYYKRHATKQDKEKRYRIAHIFISSGGKLRANQIWNIAKKDPKKFTQMAKEYSDDETTAQLGGVLGYFSASSLSNAFQKVVPRLKVGQLSSPVRTAAGFHILKLINILDGDFSSLSEERKLQLKSEMVGTEIEKRLALWLERQIRDSHIRKPKRSANASK